MEALKINWEVDSKNDKIDSHTWEVWLKGSDDDGNEYSASAIECCGEIENITEIEKL